MVYSKYVTTEGRDQILKLAFLGDNVNPFKYCALGYNKDSLASTTGNAYDFNEFEEHGYKRVEINADEDVTNNQLRASCIFEDDNYTGEDIVGEIALCDTYDGDNPTYFAFSEVPKIPKTSNVSLKYTWIINIE